MTYTSGSLIEATDYNGFISTNSANVNAIWSTGSGNYGWGESALSTVSASSTISATEWATLVNRLSSMGSQTGVTITSRTAPVAGNTVSVLANVNTDITNIFNSRGNASAVGTQFTAWTGTSSKTTATAQGVSIVFSHTVTWASANAARYFFNAGGLVKIQFGKSSTGATGDAEWNDLASTLAGAVWISGRSTGANSTIAGTLYSGSTVIGGTGTPTVPAGTKFGTTGWFQLTTSNQAIYQQYADTAPYTSNYIQVQAKTGNTGTTLDLTTTWFNTPTQYTAMSGGTAASGAVLGTAPATVVTYFPPSSTYLTSAAWGTPTIVASVA
jgi:hypothetical protein